MRIPLSLIQKYVELPFQVEEIVSFLTKMGIEVEKIIPYTPSFFGVVVAHVISIAPHPNAERLRLVTVTDGSVTQTVVCGASNVVEGMRVALAREGAKLGRNEVGQWKTEITKANIRGVESCGMLCSAEELGISEKSEGIVELPETYVLGQDLSKLFEDTIFELGLTPNLGHCLSAEGVARVLSAKSGCRMKEPYTCCAFPKETDGFSVALEDGGKTCSYGAVCIEAVVAKKSPLWLVLMLQKMGMQEQNVLVDCANYVMTCTGQPLHVFDANVFHNKKIRVCEAAGTEEVTLLNGLTCRLPEKAICICADTHVVAVAGVMGTLDSSVTEGTTSIVVESACFDAKSIRKTGKALRIAGEAVKRFERGIDPNGWKYALGVYATLIREIFPQANVQAFVDAGMAVIPSKKISVRLSKVKSILGREISAQEIETVFDRLGYSYTWVDMETVCIRVPPYRHDVNEEIDCIEEISLLTGFDEIVIQTQPKVHVTTIGDHQLYLEERRLRSFFVAAGLQEWVTCDLISPAMASMIFSESIPSHAIISVKNPVSTDQSILRPSIIPSLLDCVKRNQDHKNRRVAAFETGYVHVRNEGQIIGRLVASIVLSGPKYQAAWNQAERSFDFYDLKGIVMALGECFSIADVSFSRSNAALFHPGRQATIYFGAQQVGTMGEIHPAILAEQSIHEKVYCMELDLHDLSQHVMKKGMMQSLPLYPSIERDWTISVPESMQFKEIYDIVHEYACDLVESITLQSIFRNERLGPDVKNVTFRIVFRSYEGTLTADIADQLYAKMVEKVMSRLAF